MIETGEFSLALTGSGGKGVMHAGQVILNCAAEAGSHGIMRRSFGPQIRGGESAAMLRLADRPVHNMGDRLDLLVAFDWHNFDRLAAELPLAPGALLIHDPHHGPPPESITAQAPRRVELPLHELTREQRGRHANMIVVGLLARHLGLPLEQSVKCARHSVAHRGNRIAEEAADGVRRGFELESGLTPQPLPLSQPPAKATWMLSGNQATGLGALYGGLGFFAAYPITPSTDIAEWMARELPRTGGRFMQAEDELASTHLCLGASYGGVPAMTATSGPGLSLMMESLGMAVAAELPLVVVNVMRGGPSTGIPTKSEQADLDIAQHGLHGDAPHLVLAPNGIDDCLSTTRWAVELSEQLQTAAVVLSDQALGQTRAILPEPELDPPRRDLRRRWDAETSPYRRYAPGGDGVSAMALPGTPGGQYVAESLVHDPAGRPSSAARDHREQLDKRWQKLASHDFGKHWADIEGTGSLAIVTWGSLTPAAREARQMAARNGIDVRLISLRLLAPAQSRQMDKALEGVETLLVVEQSHSGQFHRYLRAHFELPDNVRQLHRPGPVPLRPGEIREALEGLAA